MQMAKQIEPKLGEQIVALLEKNGPMPTADIIEAIGASPQTIYNLMTHLKNNRRIRVHSIDESKGKPRKLYEVMPRRGAKQSDTPKPRPAPALFGRTDPKPQIERVANNVVRAHAEKNIASALEGQGFRELCDQLSALTEERHQNEAQIAKLQTRNLELDECQRQIVRSLAMGELQAPQPVPVPAPTEAPKMEGEQQP